MEKRHLDNADFRNIGDRRPDGNNISVHIEGKNFLKVWANPSSWRLYPFMDLSWSHCCFEHIILRKQILNYIFKYPNTIIIHF